MTIILYNSSDMGLSSLVNQRKPSYDIVEGKGGKIRGGATVGSHLKIEGS